MPTYEYKCSKCEEVFEIFQKITDAPLRECPVCGGEMKKIISGGIGIIFKGSGFYTTDHKHSSATTSPNSSKPSAELASGDEKKLDKKTDQKATESQSTKSKPS